MLHVIFFLLLCSCTVKQADAGPDSLTHVSFVDQHGMTESISSKERLKQLEKVDFLASQPYKKVLRSFGRNHQGDILSYLTSYHPNGQVHQYLEAKNSRALGGFKEWYPSGSQRVEARVVGGIADFGPAAEESWLFDGLSKAWNEAGQLVAEIPYVKGVLHGESKYYHDNGTLWKIIPYNQGSAHGTSKVFLSTGSLLSEVQFENKQKNGKALRYWESGKLAAEELYNKDRLEQGKYWSPDGKEVCCIVKGNGIKAIFGRNELTEVHEYKDGCQEGFIKVFNRQNGHFNKYTVKDGFKHGEEVEYHPRPKSWVAVPKEDEFIPKLSIQWNKGVIQGEVKTWYPNGQIESQREINSNLKHGLSTAWYEDGSLMLIEEYKNDQLIRGEYLPKGDKHPVSRVDKGKGVATLFDGQGRMLRKVNYSEGRIIE